MTLTISTLDAVAWLSTGQHGKLEMAVRRILIKAILKISGVISYVTVFGAGVFMACAYLLGSKTAARRLNDIENRVRRHGRDVERLTPFFGSSEAAGMALIKAEFCAEAPRKKTKSDLFIRALVGILDHSNKPKKHLSRLASVRSAARTRQSGRSKRSSVRQTFSARSAAKAADSGGSDGSDPEPRHQQHYPAVTLPCPTVSAFRLGGAK